MINKSTIFLTRPSNQQNAKGKRRGVIMNANSTHSVESYFFYFLAQSPADNAE